MHDNALCYEIGSSTGALINKIYHRHLHKKNVRFIGIEPILEMVEEAKSKVDKKVEFLNENIEDIILEKSNLVVGYYFLQFVQVSKRSEVLKKIYESLNEGGGLILFEKEMADDSKISKLITSSYMKFKIENGFSADEVLSKQFSLEGMMITNTHKENKKMLSDVGFLHVTTVMKYGEFNGYVCFKSK